MISTDYDFINEEEIIQALERLRELAQAQGHSVELLAMKLSAWRDDIDIEDARKLHVDDTCLSRIIWSLLKSFRIPDSRLVN